MPGFNQIFVGSTNRATDLGRPVALVQYKRHLGAFTAYNSFRRSVALAVQQLHTRPNTEVHWEMKGSRAMLKGKIDQCHGEEGAAGSAGWQQEM